MRVPKENQPAFLAAMDAYSRGMFHSGEIKVTFMHVVIAEEDPEIVMSFQGFPTEKDAKYYYNVSLYHNVVLNYADKFYQASMALEFCSSSR
jgi:hypothetical protein